MLTTKGPAGAINEIRAALDLVAEGLRGRTAVSATSWDAAIATLASSHSHLGGHTRELVYQFFRASDPSENGRGLEQALSALANALDLSPAAALVPPPGVPRRRPRRRRRAGEGQLALF
jgi:hypothetical protein